jgi:hypothetical protein
LTVSNLDGANVGRDAMTPHEATDMTIWRNSDF